MTAREMHYDFKQKLNKVDSQQYRDLVVPEIDWKLNEAQEVFVKMIAQPRLRGQLGFEMNQRTIDDIRPIVVNQSLERGTCIAVSSYDSRSFIATIPSDYWFYLGSKIFATKGKCENKKLSARIMPHDDEQDLSPFDRSSFEWRTANIRFMKDGIRIFTDGSFSVSHICMDYIKKLSMIHNAQDYQGGTYTTLTGQVLTGTQVCELPETVHREIVDLAVLITSGDLSLPDYSFKQNKLQLTN